MKIDVWRLHCSNKILYKFLILHFGLRPILCTGLTELSVLILQILLNNLTKSHMRYLYYTIVLADVNMIYFQ
jgi:hypothetical protein